MATVLSPQAVLWPCSGLVINSGPGSPNLLLQIETTTSACDDSNATTGTLGSLAIGYEASAFGRAMAVTATEMSTSNANLGAKIDHTIRCRRWLTTKTHVTPATAHCRPNSSKDTPGAGLAPVGPRATTRGARMGTNRKGARRWSKVRGTALRQTWQTHMDTHHSHTTRNPWWALINLGRTSTVKMMMRPAERLEHRWC